MSRSGWGIRALVGPRAIRVWWWVVIIGVALNGVVVGYGAIWFQLFGETADRSDYLVLAGGGCRSRGGAGLRCGGSGRYARPQGCRVDRPPAGRGAGPGDLHVPEPGDRVAGGAGRLRSVGVLGEHPDASSTGTDPQPAVPHRQEDSLGALGAHSEHGEHAGEVDRVGTSK